MLIPQGMALEYAITQATKRDKRKRSTFNIWPIPVNVTVSYNFRPVKCSTYRSTICQGRIGRLPLSIKQVLGTSRNLYMESTCLLRAIINLHMGVVAKSTARAGLVFQVQLQLWPVLPLQTVDATKKTYLASNVQTSGLGRGPYGDKGLGQRREDLDGSVPNSWSSNIGCRWILKSGPI